MNIDRTKIIKGGLTGLLGGLLYAFISFYLLYPVLKRDFSGLLLFGLQGLVLGAAFVLFKEYHEKTRLSRDVLTSNAVIGAASAFVSSIFYAIATYRSAARFGYMPGVVRSTIMSRIFDFILGSISLGVLIGLFIGFSELKKTDPKAQRQ